MGKFRVPLVEEQLRAAFERSRRSNWPLTFEEAIADEWFQRLIELEATVHVHRVAGLAVQAMHRQEEREQRRQRMTAISAARAQAPAPSPAPTSTPAPRGAKHTAGQLSLLPAIDHKRRASGERDDD